MKLYAFNQNNITHADMTMIEFLLWSESVAYMIIDDDDAGKKN